MTPYEEASQYLFHTLETVLSYLFPEGKRDGNNFIVGTIEGLPGKSFSIALEPASKRGLYKDFADPYKAASRNLCKLWKIARGIPEDNHARFFSDVSAYSGQTFGWNGDTKPTDVDWPNWPKCFAQFSDADAQRLATHPKRQFKTETLKWFHTEGHLGVYRGQIAFAMRDANDKVVGLHRWDEQAGILKFLKSPTLMVIGDLKKARTLHIHESTWDAIAMVDRTGWHLNPDILVFSTRGVSGAKLVSGRIPAQIEKIYIWEQRDQPDPKTGVPPNESWQTKVSQTIDGRPPYLVRILESCKDLNDWTIAGATAEQINFACELAQVYRKAAPTAATAPQPGPDYNELPENFPPADERPCYRVYLSSVKINDREYKAGLYLHEVAEFGDRKYPRDTWICSPLLVLAKTATQKNRNYGRLLEYHSSNGIKRNWAMPMELLAGDGLPILGRLLDDGVEISHQNRRKVLEYLSAAQPTDFLRCATRTGWYSPTTFVLTDEIITAPNILADKVWFQAASKAAEYLRGGSLENWKTNVPAKAIGNNYLIFAISLSLSGPLLFALGFPGLGIHFYGDSSSGKTSVLQAGASSWGHGHDFVQTWNLTANGIETVCVEHTDTFLALDEIKEIDARDLDRVAYSSVNGQGKRRSDRTGASKSPHLWRVVLFSTGEYSIRARLAEAGINIKTGQEMRLVDVPVTDETFGIFNNLHRNESGAQFANELRASAQRDYGHAGPLQVQAILGYSHDQLCNLHRKIVTVFPTGNAQESRVAEIFAAVALAGEIATHAKILPWTAASCADYSESDSVNAAVVLYNRWKESRHCASQFSSEHSKILRSISDAFEKHTDSRFSDLNNHPYVSPNNPTIQIAGPIVRDRLGWWDDSSGKRIYLVLSSGVREITKGFDFKRVLTALEQAEAIVKKGADSLAFPTYLPDGRTIRLYHIDPDKLE